MNAVAADPSADHIEHAASASRVSDSLRHIPIALLGSLAVGVVGVALAYWRSGMPAAIGVVAGVVLVAVSYLMSALAVGVSEAVSRSLILPMGLATYATKCCVFGVVLAALARSHWAGLSGMGYAVLASAVLWSVMQLWWTVRSGQLSGLSEQNSSPPPGQNDVSVSSE